MDQTRFLTSATILAVAAGYLLLSIRPAFGDDGSSTFSGNASWYGQQFHGKKTASGELFNMFKVTGAHRTLHLPTMVLAENPRNGKSTVVRVNDRGPFVHTRVMDLSRQGAIELGYLSHGTAYLEFTILSDENK